MQQEKTISVIVPVYNINEKFNENLQMLVSELMGNDHKFEIIVVDDGSKNYQPSFEYLSDYIKFYHYDINQGKGHALRYGFERSIGDHIVFIDADMDLHPKDIRNFMHLMEIYGVDAVIGSKRHPYSQVNYPKVRRLFSWLYQIFIRIFLNVRGVRDSQVGLKLFRREVLEKSLPRVVVKKYAFDLELLTVASRLGYDKILEAPIKLDYGKHDFGSDNPKELIHLLKVGWPLLVDTFGIIYRLRIVKYYDKHNNSGKEKD
jgi:dolichol-phosphate mannosyltransferase